MALVAHAAAFAFVMFQSLGGFQFSAPELTQKFQQILVPGLLSLGIIALTRLVLLGLIPPTFRDRVVHWKWSHPLPGARAFSRIGPRDSRVNMTRLRELHGKLPIMPAKQSQLFYSIYKQHADDVGVIDAHKSYLAARDIATINLILLFTLPIIAGIATHDFKMASWYAAAMLVAFLLTYLAAKAYAVRLVQNSLAVASQAKQPSP